MNWFNKVEERLDGRGKEALKVLLNGNDKEGEVIYIERPKNGLGYTIGYAIPWLVGGAFLWWLVKK